VGRPLHADFGGSLRRHHRWDVFRPEQASLSDHVRWSGAGQLPASTRRLEVRTPDGERLAGVQIPSQRATADGAPTLLGFGGNAWNAEATALSLHALFPHRNVVVFHYRGYAPSSGRPSAQALFSDSLIIFDHLNPGRRAHRSGRLQHRRCGRRISWPVSPCCGTDPSHAIRLARGGGP
jgi:hypothetical protein